MSEPNQPPVQAGSPSKFDVQLQLDMRFHSFIVQVGDSAIAEEITGRMVPAFCDSDRAVLYLKANMDQTLQEHQSIVAVPAAGDAARTDQAMWGRVARVHNDTESLPI